MPTATSPVASRARLLNGYRALSGLLVILVLVQAWIAGQSDMLFGDMDIFIHGIVGNVSYLVTVGVLVVTIVARANKAAIAVAAVLVVLMTVQIGLGYSGRFPDTGAPDAATRQSAAWHVPLGVAIFGFSVYQLTVAAALAKGTAAGRHAAAG